MISPADRGQSLRTRLIAVARADRSRLSPGRRGELDELLASTELPYDRDPSAWDAAIYLSINARVAANAFARMACWEAAWRVMAGAVADDASDPREAAELRLLEILLDAMHRGIAATADRMPDAVEPLIQAGFPHARVSLLDRLQQLLLMTGRSDESLRLLRLDRVDASEQLIGAANLLTYARPEVFTLAGEAIIAGADRMQCYAKAIVDLWRALTAESRHNVAVPLGLVVWALAMTGGDVSQAIRGFGRDDGVLVERLCRWLRWFGLAAVTGRVAEAMQAFDFAQHPSPGYLVAVLGRVDDAIDMLLGTDDWALAHRLLHAIGNVPQASVPRLVAAIDRMIDAQVGDPALSLDGPHHTAITLPALLGRRALLTGKLRALPAAPRALERRLTAIQAGELIALALATAQTAVAAGHYAQLAETDRHNLVFTWGRDHNDIPQAPLGRMLGELEDPQLRALGIGHYLAGLAQRRLILAPLL